MATEKQKSAARANIKKYDVEIDADSWRELVK
jgi:hypothetical protein